MNYLTKSSIQIFSKITGYPSRDFSDVGPMLEKFFTPRFTSEKYISPFFLLVHQRETENKTGNVAIKQESEKSKSEDKKKNGKRKQEKTGERKKIL